jgi:hypothetical protein
LAAGNELDEPALVFDYPDAAKLELAFTLTYGDITWT